MIFRARRSLTDNADVAASAEVAATGPEVVATPINALQQDNAASLAVSANGNDQPNQPAPAQPGSI
jgi:hypothetical protein